MKKTVSKEIDICDHCKKEEYTDKCLSCGIEHCWKCRKKLGIEYHHAVFFSGSGDGYFCNECNVTPKQNKQLWEAYKAVKALRDEYDIWWKNFNERENKAEEYLKEQIEIYEKRTSERV